MFSFPFVLLCTLLSVQGSQPLIPADQSVVSSGALVYPTFAKASSLNLTYFLTGEADLHYVIVPNGSEPLSPSEIKQFALQRQGQAKDAIVAGTYQADKPTKISFEVPDLLPEKVYDVYFVTEVSKSNGVFGKVVQVQDIVTYGNAPSIDSTSILPTDGSTSSFVMKVAASTNGTLHYAICESPMLFSPFDLYRKEPSSSCFFGKSFIVGQKQGYEVQVTGARPFTMYHVYAVAEALNDNGVLGNIIDVGSIRSHGFPPAVTNVLPAPADASTTQLNISWQLQYNASHFENPQCIQQQDCFLKQAMDVNFHYLVLKKKQVKASREITKYQNGQFLREFIVNSTSSPPKDGSLIAGTIQVSQISKKKTSYAGEFYLVDMSWIVENCEPNTEYKVFVVAETYASNGVIGTKAASFLRLNVFTTHALAPAIEIASMVPVLATTDSLRLALNVSHEALLHYLILPSTHAAAQRDFTSVKELFQILDPFTRASIFVNKTNSSFAIDLTRLRPSTSYIAWLVMETKESNGVYGKIVGRKHFPALVATTNSLPPSTHLLFFRPLPGSTQALQVRCHAEGPVNIVYVVSSLDSRQQQVKGEYHCAPQELQRENGNCTWTIANLTSNVAYEIHLHAQTDQLVISTDLSTGQMNKAKTFAFPPQLVNSDVQVFARDGSTSEAVLRAKVSATTSELSLHVLIMPAAARKLQVNATADLITCVEDLRKKCLYPDCVPSSLPSNYLPTTCSKQQSHYYYWNSNQAKMLENGGQLVELELSNFLPNTTYDVYFLSETLGSEGVFTSQEHLDVDFKTHALAPEVVKMQIVPLNASTDAIWIQVELKHCGIVHYALSTADFKDPAKMRSPEIVQLHQQAGHLTSKGTIHATEFNTTCLGNTTVHGLTPATTYHVSCITETFKSNGVYAKTPYPSNGVAMVVKTHAKGPEFAELRVRPKAFASDSVQVDLRLSQHGVVHYALFLREFNLTQTSSIFPTPVNATLYQISTFESSRLGGEMLKEASKNRTDFLGEGIMANDTLSISREDIEQKKLTSKEITKLIPGALYEWCFVTETEASNGVYGLVQCQMIRTHADYTLIQNALDAAALRPLDGRSDALEINYTMPKLAYFQANSSGEENIASLTGRLPHFALLADRTNPLSNKWIRESVRGEPSIAAAGTLVSIVWQNQTFVTVSQRLEHLQPNVQHHLFVVSESWEPESSTEGKLTEISPNTTVGRFTHANPPHLGAYTVKPTPANTTRISLQLQFVHDYRLLGHVDHLGFAYVMVRKAPRDHEDPCHLPEASYLKAQMKNFSMNLMPEEDACVAAMFRRSLGNQVQAKEVKLILPSVNGSQDGNDSMSWGHLDPGTSYVMYLTTETASSKGLMSEVYPHPLQVETFALAPEFELVKVDARVASTTEMFIEYQLNQQGHVHFVIAESGNVNDTCGTPWHIRESNRVHTTSNKHDNCSDVKTTFYRKLDVEKDSVGMPQHEKIMHLSPDTPYDVFIVTETWKSEGVLSPVVKFLNISTHAVAPILLSHGAYPSPGTAFELVVEFRLNTKGILHCVVVLEDQYHADTPLNRPNEPTGFLAPLAIAQYSITVEANETEKQVTQKIQVPYANTTYRVHMVTETLGSNGVYGTVATIPMLRTHAEAPEITESAAFPTDARLDSITVNACVSEPGNYHYYVVQPSSPAPNEKMLQASLREQALKSPSSEAQITLGDEILPMLVKMGKVTVGNFDEKHKTLPLSLCKQHNITNLNASSRYHVYLMAETYASYGVFGKLSKTPLVVRTHGEAPLPLENLECSKAPDCQKLNREECWLEKNTCGECLEGYSGTEGPANTLCSLSGIPSPSTDAQPSSHEPKEGDSTETQAPAPALDETNDIEETLTVEEEPMMQDSTPLEYAQNSKADTTESKPQERITCPPNSYLAGPGECRCSNGYSPNADGSSCVQDPAPQHSHCPLNSSPIGPGQCACNEGFELNHEQTQCIPSLVSH